MFLNVPFTCMVTVGQSSIISHILLSGGWSQSQVPHVIGKLYSIGLIVLQKWCTEECPSVKVVAHLRGAVRRGTIFTTC